MATNSEVLSQLFEIMGMEFSQHTTRAKYIHDFINSQPDEEKSELWEKVFTFWGVVPDAKLPENTEKTVTDAKWDAVHKKHKASIVEFFANTLIDKSQSVSRVVEMFLELLEPLKGQERWVVIALVFSIGSGKILPYWPAKKTPEINDEEPEDWMELTMKAKAIIKSPTLKKLQTAEEILDLLNTTSKSNRTALMSILLFPRKESLKGIIVEIIEGEPSEQIEYLKDILKKGGIKAEALKQELNSCDCKDHKFIREALGIEKLQPTEDTENKKD